MKPETPPRNRETIFRFLVAALAILALLSSIVYMLYEIVTDINKTERLLLEAFLAEEKDVFTTVTEQTPPKTDPPESEEASPLFRYPVSVDLSIGASENGKHLQNSTSYQVDEKALDEFQFEKHLFDTRPMILIYHTNPSESYWKENETRVSVSHTFTSTLSEETVVSLGKTVTDVLSSAGIASIHMTDPVADIEKTLAEYRLLYPSIRYCLDIRRDGIYTTDGRIVKSKGTLDGKAAAQLMLAVGCGDGNLSWQKNLAAADRIADMMTSAEASMVRTTLLRPESLGQQDETLHLTLFVGTTGNTHKEATAAARFFARYLALFILSNCGV